MFDLSGKAALVTGASGGIGAAIARALHGAGAKVALSGTRRPALDALAEELGPRALVVPADLADPAATEGLVKAAEEAAQRGDFTPRASLTMTLCSTSLEHTAIPQRALWSEPMAQPLTKEFLNLTPASFFAKPLIKVCAPIQPGLAAWRGHSTDSAQCSVTLGANQT